MIRAIEAQEQTGTREAREVLEKMAGGAPLAARTREAKVALERLSQVRP